MAKFLAAAEKTILYIAQSTTNHLHPLKRMELVNHSTHS